MGVNAIALLIVFSVICESIGDIQLSCNTVDPMLPCTIKCTCRYTNGAGIIWYKNETYMVDCFLKSEFCLWFNGHSFFVNSSEKNYIIEKDGYNYSSCSVYTCRDLQQPEINSSKRIAVHDSTSISALNISEPTTNHTSGFIGVTTECIYGASSEEKYLDIQWLVLMGSVAISFDPVNKTIKTLIGSCQLCDGDKATQFLIGFYHKEEMGCQGKEAKFRIILRHKGISSEPLNITTGNFYCISDHTADGSASMRHTGIDIAIANNSCFYAPICVLLLLQYIYVTWKYKHWKKNTKLPGKTKSSSTKLKRLPERFPRLAWVPVVGFIEIIAYSCCCSGTDRISTDIKEKYSTEWEGKQPNNLSNGETIQYLDSNELISTFHRK